MLLGTVLLGFVVTANRADGGFNSTLDGHRVGSRSHVLHAFAEDRLRQNRRRRGSVAGHVRRLGCHFAHHLSSHVFHGIRQFDFFCHGHAVFGDRGRPEFLVEHHVAPLGTQRDFYCVRQFIDATENCLAAIRSVYNLLCIRHLLNSSSICVRPALKACWRSLKIFYLKFIQRVIVYFLPAADFAFSRTPRISSSRRIRYSLSSILISLPEYFPNRM